MKQPLVIKVGGSLFSQPHLFPILKTWIQDTARTRDDCSVAVIAGGGSLVDVVRNWHADFDLTEDFSHQMACGLMSATAQLLGHLLELPIVAAADRESVPIAVHDLSGWAVDSDELPRRWDVTSDSIAASYAKSIAAAELILVKSSAPETRIVGELATKGYVDGHFPVAALGLPAILAVYSESGSGEMLETIVHL